MDIDLVRVIIHVLCNLLLHRVSYSLLQIVVHSNQCYFRCAMKDEQHLYCHLYIPKVTNLVGASAYAWAYL